jgi:hypothetical protein
MDGARTFRTRGEGSPEAAGRLMVPPLRDRGEEFMDHRRSLLAAVTALGLLAHGALGCGIGTNVTDGCGLRERAYTAAQNKRDGMRDRGVDAASPAYRLALDDVERARALLSECRAST